ncbi:MAG: RHS repeat protein, partial [Bacteroidales bacterium]|nr:RHS repeat protein [Bacteroidales bacterium]
MKHILFATITLFFSILSFAQTKDFWDDRTISTYTNTIEVARNSITFTDGFSTINNGDLHAYIDLLIPVGGYSAGDFNMNYVRVFAPLANNASNTAPQHDDLNYNLWSEQTQYFDGLGRPVQTVQSKASPTGADIIQPIVYDDFGRQTHSYLPYTYNQDMVNTVGAYRPNAASLDIQTDYEQQLFYNQLNQQGNVAFSETVFDNSPLNRVMQQGAPGADWQISSGNVTSFDYQTNTSSLNYHFTVDQYNMLVKAQEYPPNSLYITKTTDPDGHEVLEYKNKLGQVVISQSYIDASNYAMTIYVYDDYGLLRYVLPPEAVDEILLSPTGAYWDINDPIIAQYCYYYEYDGRHRNIYKKLPGAEPIYIIYDKRDLPVLTQDGNQRLNGEWSFVKYDAFKRPILSGIFYSTSTFNVLQAELDAHSILWETIDSQSNDYTNNALPDINDCYIQTFTYYDNYNILAPQTYTYNRPNNSFEENFNPNIKGQVTVTKTLIEDPDNILNNDVEYLYSVTYYDEYYRAIQIISDNHLGGQDIISNRYNFTGDLLETIQTHSSPQLNNPITINSTNSYDRMKRPLSTTTTIDGQSSITNFTYDELGQLTNKSIGNGVVDIGYSYNIRGWTTDISSNYFSQTMHYNTGNNPLYNGNISQIDWSSGSVNASYQYNYDGLNRILSANYSDANSADFSTTYNYDLNGNIQHLTRMGYNGAQHVQIDDLSYIYNGNQLTYVDDENNANHQNFGFVDNGAFQSSLNPDYAYDANGNLTQDLNKEIYDIDYNHINLPTQISFYDDANGSKYINYLYTPTGTKLRVQTLNGTDQNITDYVGNIIYENSELSYILFPDGRIT